jgi:hypothetical protein
MEPRVAAGGALDTLVAIRSAEPDKFYSSLSAFAARAMLGGFDRDQLVAESQRKSGKFKRPVSR